MSEIESKMGKRVFSRVNKYKEAIDNVDSTSFYHHFMLCTKYLVMFKSPQILEDFEKMNYSNFKIPSNELRQNIIDNMFDGEFNYETNSVFEFTIDEMFVNIIGNLNGGAIMTLVDILTGISGVLTSEFLVASVSASVTTHFMKTAFEGEKIYVKCQTDRSGRRIIFHSCEMYNMKFKKIATGSHVMAVISNDPKLTNKFKSIANKGKVVFKNKRNL
jgi:uncharacterized protein (TIGR00369 family)